MDANIKRNPSAWIFKQTCINATQGSVDKASKSL